MKTIVNGGATDQRFVFRDGASRDVEAISIANGKTTITDTGTVATEGSVIRFENGAYQYMEFTVVDVPSANSFVLPGELTSLVVGDDFYILKKITQRTDDTGAQLVVSSQGPTTFVLDGVDTETEKDTAVPANSRPFPVEVLLNGETAQGQDTMANSLPVVIASNQSAVPVSGPLTDTELRATPVPVSGPLTDTQLRATAVPVAGPLTDTELRATAVPVSGPLTDTQLRATAVPVSAAALPLPTGAATEATLAAASAKLPAALGQTTMAGSLSVALASDQSEIPVDPGVNSSGQTDNTSLTGTSPETATAPAGAVGFIVQAPSDNENNIRYRVGGAASDSLGMLMEPGRDSGFIPIAANVSVCAVSSGTNAFSILWVIR